MTWSFKKTFLVITLSLAVFLGCIGLGVLPVNLFFLKTTLSETVHEHTGIELGFEGPLRLRLGHRPKLTAVNVTARWPDDEEVHTGRIDRLEIQSRLASVLRRELDLTSVSGRGITIRPAGEDLRELIPQNIVLQATAPRDEPITAEVEGKLAQGTVVLRLEGANLESLLAGSDPFPFQAELNAPGSRMNIEGQLGLPWSSVAYEGKLDVQSQNLSMLLLLAGLDSPGLGALDLQSEIQLDRSRFRIDQLRGSLDQMGFEAKGQIRDWLAHPWIELDARFTGIDLDSPILDGRNSSNESLENIDLRPSLDLLSGYGAQVHIEIDQVLGAPFPIEQLSASATLDSGLLTIDHAAVSIAGIGLSARASLNASAPCPDIETAWSVPAADIEKALSLVDEGSELKGFLDQGQVSTRSCGSTLLEHLHSLETELSITGLELDADDDQDSLQLHDVLASVNWRNPGRISFRSMLLDEPLSFSLDFGSIEDITAGHYWPARLEARTESLDLRVSGQAALHETGPVLDLAMDARLGSTDLEGQLAWSSLHSGLPLKAVLHSNRFNLEDIRILRPEDGQEDAGSLDDWTGVLDDSDLIEHWLKVPSIDIALTVNQLDGTPYSIGDMALNVHIEDHRIEDGQMRLGFEGMEMTGLLNADMSGPAAKFDYRVSLKNMDIGRLLRSAGLSDSVEAGVKQADVHFFSEGATVRELTRNMTSIWEMQSLHWSFHAGPENRRFDINLSQVHVTAHPTADTVWETTGSLNGYPIKAWLQTPNVREAFNEDLPLPVKFIFGSRNDITMLEATIQPELATGTRSEIRISGRYTHDQDIDFAALPSPLEDYVFSTELTLKDNHYLATGIEARIGSSHATGRFEIRPAGEGFRFDLQLDSPLIETEDLVLWAAEIREAREVLSETNRPLNEDSPHNVGLLTLIDQYADEFIGQNTWNVDARIHELRSGGTLLGDAEIGLRMDPDTTILDPATIHLPGGDVDITYSGVRENGIWDLNLDIFIERLEYGGLARLFNPQAEASGELFAEASLHARTEDISKMESHLEGKVDLVVFPDDIRAEFLDLWASNLVFALLQTQGDQEKKLNCMVARFEVEQGIMTSRETFLDSTEIIVRARGEIDLANRQLDLLVAPQAKREKFLSISTPIVVTGPFDDFSVEMATGGFVMTMIRWYYGLIYVPWKWLTGERFPPDGIETCYRAMDWELPTEAR